MNGTPRTHATRSLVARAMTASVIAVGSLSVMAAAPASAVAAQPCHTLGTITATTTCTLDPGGTLTFVLKGGNGGFGGNAGDGGFGGQGWDGAATVNGGVGGQGGFGAIPGVGAKVTGTYTNSTAQTVTVVVVKGVDGANGADGFDGPVGVDAVASGPASSGGTGGNGQNGGDGQNGAASTITVDSTLVVSADGGTGGEGGAAGQGGQGGQSTGQVGTAGTNGFDGNAGTDGTVSTPALLPNGWALNATTDQEAANVSVVATAGQVPSPPPSVTPLFLALTPQRLLDTRESTKLVGGAAGREVEVVGHAGVPADATAVALNVTATGSTEPGFVTMYPCGQSLPPTSTVNFVAGQTVPNAATVTLAAGKVCAYSNVDVDVVLDVNGAYSATYGTGLLTAVTPARLLDTREGDGAKVQPGVATTVVVAGASGVAQDADAVVLNVTVTEPESDGYLTLYPCGADVPLASSLNFVADQTVPNQVTVAVGDGGAVCAIGTAATHLVVDVDAAFGPTGAGTYGALTPDRLLDTREGQALTAGVPRELTIGGASGVAADASAVALNVTVTNPAAAGYVTVYPCDAQVPVVSNLNVTAGQTVANAVTVGLASGKVCVLSTTDTDLVVDVSGQFLNVPG